MTEDRSSRPAESPPAISIVLPTHNGSRYLDQSIKSVLDQSFSDWELIVVNDASTDNTRDLVDCWAARDPRVRAIHLSQNRKLPGALNEVAGLAVLPDGSLYALSENSVLRIRLL